VKWIGAFFAAALTLSVQMDGYRGKKKIWKSLVEELRTGDMLDASMLIMILTF